MRNLIAKLRAPYDRLHAKIMEGQLRGFDRQIAQAERELEEERAKPSPSASLIARYEQMIAKAKTDRAQFPDLPDRTVQARDVYEAKVAYWEANADLQRERYHAISVKEGEELSRQLRRTKRAVAQMNDNRDQLG